MDCSSGGGVVSICAIDVFEVRRARGFKYVAILLGLLDIQRSATSGAHVKEESMVLLAVALSKRLVFR